jgi:xylan 1,4-beta-xylosidase
MTAFNRRQTLTSLIAGTAILAVPEVEAAPRKIAAVMRAPPAGAISPSGIDWAWMTWPRGIENQRIADMGNGRFLNPILGGDHPDPSIIREGRDYYMTFSSFDAYPGLAIWHSRDLVNWQPMNAALKKPIGSVWAPDLCKYKDRYYIYIPTRNPNGMYVIYAPAIEGPWSDPVELRGMGRYIDPNHVVGEDGKRYLALSGGDLVELTEDGLSTVGEPRHIYDPWHYPEEWVVESFSPEGPKILRHEGFYYMLTAVGGTAGPPTGHMVIAARARSLFGPWQNAPNNPLVRTRSAAEKWWSRGHASAIEAPDRSWWLVYHGFENGFWTLGRQTLLAPMRWTKDGWIEALGGDLSRPIQKPRGGEKLPHGMAHSDDFSSARFGTLWSFYKPEPNEAERVRRENGALVVKGKGTGPFDCSPLCLIAGDLRYQIEVEIEISGGAQAGLLLFYNKRLYCGLGFNAERFVQHRAGMERNAAKPDAIGSRAFLRIANDANIVTIHHSPDGKIWTKYGVQMEVSGYNHNTGYDFLALKPALYVAGPGEARFRNFTYRAL